MPTRKWNPCRPPPGREVDGDGLRGAESRQELCAGIAPPAIVRCHPCAIDVRRSTPYNAPWPHRMWRAMPYLIDGHNLIPRLGLRLSDPDDEAKLTLLLQRYFARTGHKGTVYFDRRTPGGATGISSRHLTVRFIAPPRTADDAIRAHLSRLHGEAHNWAVISDDQAIRRSAERAGARWLSAAAFAAEVRSARRGSESEKPEASLSPDDLAEFERLFRAGKHGEPPS